MTQTIISVAIALVCFGISGFLFWKKKSKTLMRKFIGWGLDHVEKIAKKSKNKYDDFAVSALRKILENNPKADIKKLEEEVEKEIKSWDDV